MEALWSHIEKHLAPGNYEICTVDERADGLLFYGADEVEHLTNESTPYPTFTKRETVVEEAQEFIRTDESGFFLAIEDREAAEAIDTLKKCGVKCRMVHLPHHRAMLSPCLTSPGNNMPNDDGT